MRTICRCSLLICCILLFTRPLPVHAIPAITCHCFTNRSFDVAHPTAADAYFLAMTQNSFFAVVFNVDKKLIVLKKQQGTSSDDLWVAYWVASKSAASPESLLNSRLARDSWTNVIVPMQLPPKMLGVRFYYYLTSNLPSERLSQVVVDELLIKCKLLNESDVTVLRKDGATNQEIIIAAVIAAKMNQHAMQLFREVKSGTKSWGSLLSAAKIDAKNIQHEISTLF
ncbi:MAG: hypothetical protein PHI31_06330 [Desulfuromonadaceae bacterium]|nr:hypothetical protein [Desulfuromonadaceae bacterium]